MEVDEPELRAILAEEMQKFPLRMALVGRGGATKGEEGLAPEVAAAALADLLMGACGDLPAAADNPADESFAGADPTASVPRQLWWGHNCSDSPCSGSQRTTTLPTLAGQASEARRSNNTARCMDLHSS